jgi:cytochrome P450
VTVHADVGRRDFGGVQSPQALSSLQIEPRIIRGIRTPFYTLWGLRDPIRSSTAIIDRYGPLVVFEAFGPFPRRRGTTIWAIGEEFDRMVLGNPQVWRTTPLPTDGPNGSALERLADNVVSANGPRQAHYRKLVAQPLRSTNIEHFAGDLGRLMEDEVASWPLGAVDLWLLARKLMRPVAVALLFGNDQRRGAAFGDLLDKLFLEAKCPQVQLLRKRIPGLAYDRLLNRAEEVERCALEFATDRRASRSDRDLVSIVANAPDETGAIPTPQAVVGQIPILFAATYETCQIALTWTLLLLAQHPQVACDLPQEISSAFAGAPVDAARLAALPLLDAVVRESMRILPPVPFQRRRAAEATTLGRYDVAPGASVIISPYFTNRDPQLYDAPARFRPERWSRINPSPFAHLVFSGGPRTCPGYAFGTWLVKAALAAILSRFRIAIVPGTRIDVTYAVTFRPRDGLPAVLHPADGAWAAAPVKGRIHDMVEMDAPTIA